MDNIPNQPYYPYPQKRNIEGSNAVLILGILSLVLMGLIGLVLAIVALSKAKECNYTYQMNPDAYTESSLKNVKAGKICAIVSLSIMGFLLLLVIFFVAMSN